MRAPGTPAPESRSAAGHAPLARAVVQALAATEDHTLRAGYAELYDYDSDDDELTLEPGAQANL